jgi:hypothetical protein
MLKLGCPLRFLPLSLIEALAVLRNLLLLLLNMLLLTLLGETGLLLTTASL